MAISQLNITHDWADEVSSTHIVEPKSFKLLVNMSIDELLCVVSSHRMYSEEY